MGGNVVGEHCDGRPCMYYNMGAMHMAYGTVEVELGG